MKCRFCETQLSENDKYCPHCGMKVEQRPVVEERMGNRLPTLQNQSNHKNVIIWGALIIIILSAFVLNGILKGDKKEKNIEDDYGWAEDELPEKYDYKDLSGQFILDKGQDLVISNLNNGGYICDDATAIYMVNDDGNIVRFNKSMMSKEDIYEGNCGELQISEGFLYFKDYSKQSFFYKMDLKTKEVTMVIEEDVYYPRVYGNVIYYQNDGDNESLYRLDLTTNEKTKLNEETTYNIQLVGNMLYYTTRTHIKAMNVDSGEVITIKEQLAFSMVAQEGMLYYIDGTTSSIYKIDVSNTDYKTTRLNRESSSDLIVSGDQIYYLDSSNQVINMNTEGLNNQLLNAEQTGELLQLQGEYLILQDDSYYSDYEWYRMDINGENGEYVFSQSTGSYI